MERVNHDASEGEADRVQEEREKLAVQVIAMARESLARLSLEEQVQSLLFVSSMRQLQSFHVHLTLGVILDRDL